MFLMSNQNLSTLFCLLCRRNYVFNLISLVNEKNAQLGEYRDLIGRFLLLYLL